MPPTTLFPPFAQVVGSLPELGSWDAQKAPSMQWCAGHRWKLEVTLPKTPFEFKVRGLNGLLVLLAYPKHSGTRGLSMHATSPTQLHTLARCCESVNKGAFKDKTFCDASLPRHVGGDDARQLRALGAGREQGGAGALGANLGGEKGRGAPQ